MRAQLREELVAEEEDAAQHDEERQGQLPPQFPAGSKSAAKEAGKSS
jgi:hypothetical protein